MYKYNGVPFSHWERDRHWWVLSFISGVHTTVHKLWVWIVVSKLQGYLVVKVCADTLVNSIVLKPQQIFWLVVITTSSMWSSLVVICRTDASSFNDYLFWPFVVTIDCSNEFLLPGQCTNVPLLVCMSANGGGGGDCMLGPNFFVYWHNGLLKNRVGR